MASKIREAAEGLRRAGGVVASEFFGVGENVAYDVVFAVGGRNGI